MTPYLVLSAVLFSIGAFGLLARRNLLIVLMSLELMFNAVNISAVAMSRYVVPPSLLREAQTAVTRDIESTVQTVLTGQIFAVFVITVAAAEIALALGYGKPVVGLGTWRLSDPGGVEDTRIVRADGPVEAVEQAIAAAEGVRG